MIKIAQAFIFSAVILFTGALQAAGFTVFENIEQCENARAAGKAIVYKPSTIAPFKRSTGWTKHAVPAGGACLGKAHVLEEGAAKNGMSVYVAEGFVYWKQTLTGAFRMNDCSNPFEQIVLTKSTDKTLPQQPVVVAQMPTPPPLPCTENCGDLTKTQTITHVVKEVKVCETANGTRFSPVNGECIFPVTKAQVSMEVEAKATCATCSPSTPAKPIAQPTATPATCTNCKPREEVKVTREEKRTDGRCFVQTNMGYRFELRANATSGRLMASMVDPASEKMVEGTKALYVGNLQASKNSQGVDCDGMQAQLYVPANWEAVRSAYELPSACRLTAKVGV